MHQKGQTCSRCACACQDGPLLQDMLSRQAARRYHPGEIYVTENGVDVPNENSLLLADALNDTFRVNFYQGYVQAAQQAVNDGVPLKGYFAWSLLGAPLVCQHARSRAVLPRPLAAHCRSQVSAHVCS